LEHAKSEDDIAWVAAAAFEAVVDLRYEALGSTLDEALRRNAKLRVAFQGVITSHMPDELRALLDAIDG